MQIRKIESEYLKEGITELKNIAVLSTLVFCARNWLRLIHIGTSPPAAGLIDLIPFRIPEATQSIRS